MSEEVWIDEKGTKVKIRNFFSRIYIDEEIEKLNAKYQIWECNGESRSSSLGKAQVEGIVARLLILVRAGNYGSKISLIGVKKTEFDALLRIESADYIYLPSLIEEGFLREKLVKGDVILFPTEKLLENQRISKS